MSQATTERSPTKRNSLPHNCLTIKHHVSSTLDDLGQECVPETYLHRIIFMAMMSELEVTNKPHNNVELCIQHAHGLCDHVARFRLGYWIFVFSESEKTWKCDKLGTVKPERQLGQESFTRSSNNTGESVHPVVLCTTIFVQGREPSN